MSLQHGQPAATYRDDATRAKRMAVRRREDAMLADIERSEEDADIIGGLCDLRHEACA
jgi:hypothetical protein